MHDLLYISTRTPRAAPCRSGYPGTAPMSERLYRASGDLDHTIAVTATHISFSADAVPFLHRSLPVSPLLARKGVNVGST